MKRLCLALLVPFALAACDNSSVRDTLGLSRKAPDEFRVVSRPPLSVPPEFNLRPPAKPGEEAGTGLEMPARDQAKALVTGDVSTPPLNSGTADTAVMSVSSAPLSTGADAQFLQNAGAQTADPAIRASLKAEEEVQADEDKSILEKLREPSTNEPVVKPDEEAQRIKSNASAGQPVTAGETPMDKAKDTGTLGKIFGY